MTRQEYNREASSQATCNWVEVRNKAAIAIMQSVISARLYDIICINPSHESVAEWVVKQTDALVEQLKGE